MSEEISVTDLLRGQIDEVLGKVRHKGMEIIITRYGKPVARLVPLEDPKLATDPMANRSLAPVPAGAIPTSKKRR